MAENQHPVTVAAIAVAGTIGLGTVIVHQWMLPTITASLDHKIEILEAQIVEQNQTISALKKKQEDISNKFDSEKNKLQIGIENISRENDNLEEKIFYIQKGNMFLIDNPYPIGLDKIKIGDKVETVYEKYDQKYIKTGKRTLSIDDYNDIFLAITYVHSSSDKTKNEVDTIRYSLERIIRIVDETLPKIPKIWLEETLVRVLGEPYFIGRDNDCLFWKHSNNELVYYKKGADWYSVNGLAGYPPGCHISEDQFKKMESRG